MHVCTRCGGLVVGAGAGAVLRACDWGAPLGEPRGVHAAFTPGLEVASIEVDEGSNVTHLPSPLWGAPLCSTRKNLRSTPTRPTPAASRAGRQTMKQLRDRRAGHMCVRSTSSSCRAGSAGRAVVLRAPGCCPATPQPRWRARLRAAALSATPARPEAPVRHSRPADAAAGLVQQSVLPPWCLCSRQKDSAWRGLCCCPVSSTTTPAHAHTHTHLCISPAAPCRAPGWPWSPP
jgi:hypothetical protein